MRPDERRRATAPPILPRRPTSRSRSTWRPIRTPPSSAALERAGVGRCACPRRADGRRASTGRIRRSPRRCGHGCWPATTALVSGVTVTSDQPTDDRTRPRPRRGPGPGRVRWPSRRRPALAGPRRGGRARRGRARVDLGPVAPGTVRRPGDRGRRGDPRPRRRDRAARRRDDAPGERRDPGRARVGRATLALGASLARLHGGADVRLDDVTADHVRIELVAGRSYHRVTLPDGGTYAWPPARRLVPRSGPRSISIANRPSMGGRGSVCSVSSMRSVCPDPDLQATVGSGPCGDADVDDGGASDLVVGPIDPSTLDDPWLVANARRGPGARASSSARSTGSDGRSDADSGRRGRSADPPWRRRRDRPPRRTA